eukprot:CAMPEP_0172059594 /NCGR_PEP_ID=MMETSP1043-20130122/7507_1 /TAXON_ID=464988 /ORGANISM="Hemiselmis andersenii, Strain CCMP441" /LENGTH=99 /DNA_ID=CAMNT_0012719289 /DNA_START=273 /DNA_END=569 /DNA_ORIENTATION=-
MSSRGVESIESTLSPALRALEVAADPSDLTLFTTIPPLPSLFLKVTPNPHSLGFWLDRGPDSPPGVAGHPRVARLGGLPLNGVPLMPPEAHRRACGGAR